MRASTAVYGALLMCLLASISVLARLRAVLHTDRTKARRYRCAGTHLLIVLGSGGHTAEMAATLHRAVTEEDHPLKLNFSDFSHRTWVVGSGDSISAERAKAIEGSAGLVTRKAGAYHIQVVPRAREIHQPLATAPLSSLRCLFACVNVLMQSRAASGDPKDFPDLILCNGPATATIVILASLLLRFFNIRNCNSKGKMRTIYFESFARVERLSLSGKILLRLVDRFLVQWPQLEDPRGKAEYWGILV